MFQVFYVTSEFSIANIAAKRGVKLRHDLLKVIKYKKRFQDILQVIKTDRKLIPNERKRYSATQPEKPWFLAVENS